MGAMRESCSVCRTEFDVQFRYQMEERDGGFSFYCSQKCLQHSQSTGADGAVNCDACAKRCRVDLVSQVLYLGGRRRYACTLDCRGQLIAEARGLRLGIDVWKKFEDGLIELSSLGERQLNRLAAFFQVSGEQFGTMLNQSQPAFTLNRRQTAAAAKQTRQPRQSFAEALEKSTMPSADKQEWLEEA